MKGIFWNIRGLNRPGRNLSLGQLIRDTHVDFVGVQETKKVDFSQSFLKNLVYLATFCWHFLPTKGPDVTPCGSPMSDCMILLCLA